METVQGPRPGQEASEQGNAQLTGRSGWCQPMRDGFSISSAGASSRESSLAPGKSRNTLLQGLIALMDKNYTWVPS